MTAMNNLPPDIADKAFEQMMRDAQGRLVPVSKIKAADLLQNDLVETLIRDARALSDRLTKFRASADSMVSAFLDVLAQQYDAKRGGRKGNVTLVSFDGTQKVIIQVQDHIDFGPELQTAKSLVDQCINNWAVGASDNIKALVNDAFQVDKSGRINRDRILGLRRLAIDDPIWARAMEAIADSIRVIGSKSYMRFYTRANAEAPWNQVVLDLANA